MTALTLANALCGFAGIVALGFDGARGVSFAVAATFAAWFFDVCDGPAAQRLGVASAAGAVLDSLSDAVSFGVLPALVVAVAVHDASPVAAIAAAAAFLGAALLRLSRYTVGAVTAPAGGARFWFTGLPSPVAAMSVAASVLAHLSPWGVLLTAAATAALMLSPLRYADLVRAYASKRIPLWTLAVPAAAGVLVDWRLVLAAIFASYALSGAVLAFARERRDVAVP